MEVYYNMEQDYDMSCFQRFLSCRGIQKEEEILNAYVTFESMESRVKLMKAYKDNKMMTIVKEMMQSDEQIEQNNQKL